MAPYRVAFIIEQVLGHITHTRNLQACVPGDPEIDAHWGLATRDHAELHGRIPIYRGNWTVRAGIHARLSLRAISRAGPLDAIFFHTQVPALFSLDWLQRVPSVVSIDATPTQIDELGRYYQHKQGPVAVEVMKWRLNRACFQAARRIVAWSDWAKRGLVREYDVPAERIDVIPPGVTVQEWARPTPRQPHEGPVKILFVGGDLERKGGLLLIDAFRALRHLGVELHVVTRDAVEPEAGLFVYHDMQPNSQPLKDLYHTCDIFALPTYADALPMVLAEASAAGLPTVTTHLAGIPEIVRDGQTGYTIPIGDTAALRDALHRLVVDPELRLHLGARAVRHVHDAYDARKNAAQLLALIKAEIPRSSEVFRPAA